MQTTEPPLTPGRVWNEAPSVIHKRSLDLKKQITLIPVTPMHRVGVLSSSPTVPPGRAWHTAQEAEPTQGKGGHRHLPLRRAIHLPSPSHGHTVLDVPGLPRVPTTALASSGSRRAWAQLPLNPEGPKLGTATPTNGPSHLTGTSGTKELAQERHRLLEKGGVVGGPYYLPLHPSTRLWKPWLGVVGQSSRYRPTRVPIL